MTAKIEHQPRERSVPCQQCRRRDTWEVSAVCDSCAKRGRLLELTTQYVHTLSSVGKGVILTQVAELLPELRTVEQLAVWEQLRSAVSDYEFAGGPLAAVETALAAT